MVSKSPPPLRLLKRLYICNSCSFLLVLSPIYSFGKGEALLSCKTSFPPGDDHVRHPLLLLLPLGPLALALGIDLTRKRILKPQREHIHNIHPPRQQQARGLAKPERRPQEAHRRPPVHRRAAHVEGEPRDHLVHQDAKVVAQERARDAERPRARDDEDVAGGEEQHGGELGERVQEQRVRGLLGDGGLVEEVADEAEREDGGREGVAGVLGVAAEELGEDLVVVFLAGDDAVRVC